MAKATTEQIYSVAKWQVFNWKHPFEMIQWWNQIKWDKVFGNGIFSIWVNNQLPHSLKLPNVKIEFKWNYIVISMIALLSSLPSLLLRRRYYIGKSSPFSSYKSSICMNCWQNRICSQHNSHLNKCLFE